MYKKIERFWCSGYPCAQKMLRIMKLATLILMTTMLHVSAATMAQKLTLQKRNVSIGEIFKEIRKQTGYTVLLAADQLDVSRKLDVDFKQVSLDKVMDRVLPGNGFTYQIADNNILVEKKEEKSFIQKIGDYLAAIEVRGKVVDEQGLPLPGASVKVKGTNKSTITDKDGFFVLNGITEGSVVEISYIGFVAREIPAAGNLGTIKLLQSDSKLDEVQVIAYGTQTQRMSLGNVATVSAKDIAKQPVNNVLNALQGRVPGLFITQSNGLNGGTVTTRIQGQNSFRSGNEPFFVIDGMPYAGQNTPNLGAMLGFASGPSAGNGSPLAFINPGDIESISVLKDAEATAIYGSRAANGAILITTKKGRAGDTKVEINAQQGNGQVAKNLKLMTTQQHLDMRREAFQNDGLVVPNIATTPTNTAYDVNGHWNQNDYTDWQEKLIGGTAHYTNINSNISGGSSETQYLLGGTYHRETTVFPGDFDDVKAGLNFSLNNTSKNQRFKSSFRGTYVRDVNQLPLTDLTNSIYFAPNAPSLYLADGSLNWAPNSFGTSSWDNPLAVLNNRYKVVTGNLNLNGSLSYNVWDNLVLQSTFGYNDLQRKENTQIPMVSQRPENRATALRSSSFGFGSNSSWIVEPQIRYNAKLGRGTLGALLGSSMQRKEASFETVNGSGYNSDLVLGNMMAATNLSSSSAFSSIYKYFGFFGSINYNIDNKYLFSANGRRDGSSRFGSRNKFNNLGSISAGWIFSEEKFVKDHMRFLSFGKIRSNYGVTGNDQILDYAYLDLYNPMYAGVSYQGINALAPLQLTNPFIQWEENWKLNVGLDLGFFKDRIVMGINYNRNRSSNQLITSNLPSTTGFGSIAENFPALVENKGWEFTLNTDNLEKGALKWSTNFNLTVPRNRLVEFDGIEKTSFASSLEIGKSITSRKVYHVIGIDPATGVVQFANAKGLPVTSPSSALDRTVLIDLAPRLFGGLENSFSYKGFQLDFLFSSPRETGRTLTMAMDILE